ncbi:MAG: GNAT family N-acetyltransferase [Muribaculaceae bacterium]
MNDNILSDNILMLRAIEVTDVDTLMAWENDSSQWDSCNTSAPFSRKQLWDYAVNYNNDIYATGAIRLMVEECNTGNLVGSIDIYDFNRHHNRASVGLYIDAHHRGKGYGVCAMRLALQYACSFLGMHQVVAEVATDNTASLHMLKACGFTECGTLRDWFRHGSHFSDGILMQYISQ